MSDDDGADDAQPEGDMLYEAFGIIANVSEGDWFRQTDEWREAAVRWRGKWHEHLRAPATVCVRLDGLADQIAAWFGLWPCGKWSTCSGGDNPTTRLDCSDDQCVNPECVTRVPCINRWHKIAGFVQSLAVQ
jgi:hypothetical protein